jgi:hypothetical protein
MCARRCCCCRSIQHRKKRVTRPRWSHRVKKKQREAPRAQPFKRPHRPPTRLGPHVGDQASEQRRRCWTPPTARASESKQLAHAFRYPVGLINFLLNPGLSNGAAPRLPWRYILSGRVGSGRACSWRVWSPGGLAGSHGSEVNSYRLPTDHALHKQPKHMLFAACTYRLCLLLCYFHFKRYVISGYLVFTNILQNF